jgi:hypothetical protein
MRLDEEKIALLEQFDAALDRWFHSLSEDPDRGELRRSLNHMAPTARILVDEAGCGKRVTVAPPPMIGGPILHNIDPFDMLFDSPFGMSLIPTLRDMTQQAMGVFRSGRVPPKGRGKPQKKNVVLAAPQKVTLIWLVHNVPITMWVGAAAIACATIAGAFMLGIKASSWSFVHEILNSLAR